MNALITTAIEVLPPAVTPPNNDELLTSLVKDIESAHERAIGAATTAVAAARRVGELLLQAKPLVSHGGWLQWLAAERAAGNITFSDRTAQAYMRLAGADPQRVADLPLREAMRLIAAPAKPGKVTGEPTAAPTITAPPERDYSTSRKRADRANRYMATMTFSLANEIAHLDGVFGDVGGIEALDPAMVKEWTTTLRAAARAFVKLAKRMEAHQIDRRVWS